MILGAGKIYASKDTMELIGDVKEVAEPEIWGQLEKSGRQAMETEEQQRDTKNRSLVRVNRSCFRLNL
jgi:hypothetical protein